MESYLKESTQLTIKNFGYKSSLMAIYGFFVVLILVGAFFAPITLILSIPFLFMPLTLGLVASNSSINIGLKNPIIAFFIFFARYYRDLLFGCFRSIFGFLKALVVYLAYSTIISLIMTIFLMNSCPAFIDLLSQIESGAIKTFEELATQLQAIPEYNFGLYLNFVISFGFAVYAFIHHILTNSVKYSFLFSSKRLYNYRDVNLIHRYAFKKYRKNFYFNYYSIAIFLVLLFVGGYVGGLIFVKNNFNMDFMQSSIVGLFVGSGPLFIS